MSDKERELDLVIEKICDHFNEHTELILYRMDFCFEHSREGIVTASLNREKLKAIASEITPIISIDFVTIRLALKRMFVQQISARMGS